MKIRVSSIMVALVFVAVITGCSKSPTTEYDAGKATIEQARLAEADVYASNLLTEATDSLNAAQVEIQKQDGKFSMLRSYDKAKATIVAAQQIAEKASVQAEAEKERIRVADSTFIDEINALMVETGKVIATAPKGKGSRVDLKVMKADLDAAKGALTAASQDFQNGSYMTANNKLSAIKTQVTDMKSQIEAASTTKK